MKIKKMLINKITHVVRKLLTKFEQARLEKILVFIIKNKINIFDNINSVDISQSIIKQIAITMLRALTSKILVCFCNQKLGQGGIQAVWAEAIFTQIQKGRERHTKNLTLVDHLRQYRLPSESLERLEKFAKNKEDIQQARKKVMQIFDPFIGAPIPLSIIQCQNRFTQSKNIQNQITFFPNTYTTSLIFTILSKNFDLAQKQMIVGKQGISKSLSLLLAWHLSDITSRFRFNNPAIATQLVKNNLLRKNFRKIFYLSFRDEPRSMLYYIQLLKTQCPEALETVEKLGEQLGRSFTRIEGPTPDLENYLECLKIVYERKNISSIVIMDQINTLAQRFHIYNQTKRKIAQKESDGLPDQKLLSLISNEKIIYYAIKANFDQLLNSSTNIQQHMLHPPFEKNHIYYTLNVNRHTFITIQKCKYDRADKINKAQLFRFIWYESARMLNKSEANILEKFFQKACDEQSNKQKEVSSLMTPLSINFYLKNRQLLINSMRKDINQCLKLVGDSIQDIQNAGMQNKEQKIEKFLNDQFKIYNTPKNQNVQQRVKLMVKDLKQALMSQEKVFVFFKFLRHVDNLLAESKLNPQRQSFIQKVKDQIQFELKNVNFQDIDKTVQEKIGRIAQIELKQIPNQQPHAQLKRFRDSMQNEFQQWQQANFKLYAKFKMREAALFESKKKEISQKTKKALNNLVQLLQIDFSLQNEWEVDEVIRKKTKKFVEYQVLLDDSPLKKNDMKARLNLKPSNASCKEQSLRKFLEESLNSSHLPSLEQEIYNKVEKFVKKVSSEIEKKSLQLVQEKASTYLKDEKDKIIQENKYAIALDCAAYYELHKDDATFKKIPLSAINSHISKSTIMEYYNKDFFQYQQQTNSLDLKVSKKELGSVSLNWMFNKIGIPSDDIVLQGALAGMTLEYLIILWFRKNPNCIFNIGKETYPIDGFETFLHFLGQKQQSNLKHNLEKMLSKASERFYCFGRPVTEESFRQSSNIIQISTSPNNPKFDLLGVKKNQDESLQIITVDFTVINIEDAVLSKEIQTKALINKLLEKNSILGKKKSDGKLKISKWNHIIACKKKFANSIPQKYQKLKTKISIKRLDICSIGLSTIQKQSNLSSKKLFDRILKIFENLEKEKVREN